MTAVFAFVVGAIWGSFLNVCIYRLPRGLSIIRPRSFCPSCGSPIRARDNVPLVSFFLLKGRCRHCRSPIPWRYPVVEAITGGLAVLCHRLLPFPLAIAYFLFLSALLVASFIDLEHRIIPDEISLGGMGAGVVLSLLGVTLPLREALLGIGVGAGGLFLVGWLYELVRGQEGLGGGDVKLMGMIGAFLGLEGALFALFSGALLGALVGLILMWKEGADTKYAIPFGPFLSLGALMYLTFGGTLVGAYLSFFS